MIESVKQVIRRKPENDNKKKSIQRPNLIKNLAIFLIILLVVFAYIIVHQAIKQAPNANITVSRHHLNIKQFDQVSAALNSQESGSFFSVNLKKIQNKVLTFSWVEKVDIRRDWHKGIIIEVFPRRAIARFGSDHLLDAKGEVFSPARDDAMSYSLVMLQGNPDQSKVIMHQMKKINEWYEPLGLSVDDIILTPRMTWLVKFNSGLRLLVDGENTAEKLMTVSKVLQNQLADKRENIQSIDLRYKNGFAISWRSKSTDS